MSDGNGDTSYDPPPVGGGRGSPSNIPVPDPTRLTTQLVDRALAAFREVVETRLKGMDRATALLAEELVKQTTNLLQARDHMRDEFAAADQAIRESYSLQIQNVTLQIRNVADVDAERFSAIDGQFRERDTRTDQTDKERKISLDAALAAAKEAVGEQNRANSQAIAKSEIATQKQIDANAVLMTTSIQSLQNQIADLKGRLDKGEGLERGTTETRQRNQLQSNWSIGSLITVGLAFGTAAIAILIAVFNHK